MVESIGLLVVVKSILYEGTIALGIRVWTLGRICEDLSLEVMAVDLGGGRRLWRHDAGSMISRKKRRERSSLRVANESRFTWFTVTVYGIDWETN